MQIKRPSDDEQRVQTLHALNILDQQPDPQFLDITKLVSTIFRVSCCHAWQLSQLAAVAPDLHSNFAKHPAPSPCLSSARHSCAGDAAPRLRFRRLCRTAVGAACQWQDNSGQTPLSKISWPCVQPPP